MWYTQCHKSTMIANGFYPFIHTSSSGQCALAPLLPRQAFWWPNKNGASLDDGPYFHVMSGYVWQSAPWLAGFLSRWCLRWCSNREGQIPRGQRTPWRCQSLNDTFECHQNCKNNYSTWAYFNISSALDWCSPRISNCASNCSSMLKHRLH